MSRRTSLLATTIDPFGKFTKNALNSISKNTKGVASILSHRALSDAHAFPHTEWRGDLLVFLIV